MTHLILLHGALGHSEQFTPYRKALEAHFHVHTPLFSGHGRTPFPEAGISTKQYTRELSAWYHQQGIDKAHLFGHSMGGYIALNFSLQHADKVHTVMTLGTKLEWTEEQALRESRFLDPEAIQRKVPRYAAQLEAQHGPEWRSLLPAIAGLMQELGKAPVLTAAQMSEIPVPVQLMLGDRDQMVSLQETYQAQQSIPDARLAVLPGTPHPMDKVRPKLLLDLISDFLQIDLHL